MILSDGRVRSVFAAVNFSAAAGTLTDEGSEMDENRKDINNDASAYEPNFILKETPHLDPDKGRIVPPADQADAQAGRSESPQPGAEADSRQAPAGAQAGRSESPQPGPEAGRPRTGRPDSARPGIGPNGPQAKDTQVFPAEGIPSGAAANAAGTPAAGGFRPGSAASSAADPGRRPAGSNGTATSFSAGGVRPQAGAAPGSSGSAQRSSGAAGAGAARTAAGAAHTRASQARDSRADTGPVGGRRPLFENPSFTEGTTGAYTDPRENFRYGESASWNNGMGRRNADKEYKKKTSKPITLTRKGLGLLIACCMLISALFGMGGALLGNAMTQTAHQTQSQAQTASASSESGSSSSTSDAGYSLQSATGSSMTVKEVTAIAKDSVVEIRTEGVTSDSWMQQFVTEGAGSGVIISEDGYIMTNNHVIANTNKITVKTTDGTEYDAKLIGTDDTNDVAVIKVDASGLTPATYGNSDQLEVGELAVAIGNPLGELGGSVSAGIISATDRELAIDGKTLHLLQTDSSINPGNSGGGLFNGSGQLIGLVVAKSSGSDVEGLGFAIPINTAANVAAQLMDKGYVSGQPSTGMTYQESPASSGNTFESLFGGGSSAKQVTIYSVNGENANKAGFQQGDIVLAVDDQEIDSFDTLSSIITSHKVGDEVTFTISRNGSEKKIKLELEEKQQAQANSKDGSGEQDQDASGEENEGNEDGADGQDGQDQNGDPWNGQNPFGEGGSGGGNFFDFFFGQ